MGIEELTLWQPPLKELVVNTHPIDETLLIEHKAKYGNGNLEWPPEILLAIKGRKWTAQSEFIATTNFEVPAIRRGEGPDISPVILTGLVKTSDDQFVYGVRSGQVNVGTACIVPAGHAQYADRNIFGGLARELVEELGIESLKELSLLGQFYESDFYRSVVLVFYGETDLSSKQLKDIHTKAFEIYQKSLSSGSSEVESRLSIAQEGKPNVDAWEHSKLLFLDPADLHNIVGSGQIEDECQIYSLLNLGKGPLEVYNRHRLQFARSEDI